MIRVEHLYKHFETESGRLEVLKDVSFTVNRGEIYGIIGLSGAGKSTLIRCINRLEEPTSGDVYVDGENLVGMNHTDLLSHRKQIGMIFQSFNLFHQKTVAKNIAYPLEISGLSKGDIGSRVDELLEFVDLKEKKDAYPAQLSGGQKQRVAIARALATKPKLLLSDEGTSALDPANTQVILDLIRRTVKELGLTVVMITHQMEVAKEICDRIAVMENGRIIEENTVAELFRNPKEKRTLSFIKGLQDDIEEEIYEEDEYTSDQFDGLLVRLTFDDTTAQEPIVSMMVKEYNIVVNILSGNINRLHTTRVGYLLLELRGEQLEIRRVLVDLKEKGINVEVLQ
ncbi:MAG: ATP-binding cassette domain-containing protein [Tissierellia bacterium]|nr:ATP-binding cassette domain-containing protein [Tissierellia bacterium]